MSLFNCHLFDPAAGATGSIVLSRRIGAASFGKCLLRGARVREHTNQAVVALVAVPLINLILLIAVLLQFLDGRPWPCPCGWILNRDLVGKRIGIDALVPLDQMQILAGIMIFVPLVDRKSTRLNSSHSQISYAVFCLKKKKKNQQEHFNK